MNPRTLITRKRNEIICLWVLVGALLLSGCAFSQAMEDTFPPWRKSSQTPTATVVAPSLTSQSPVPSNSQCRPWRGDNCLEQREGILSALPVDAVAGRGMSHSPTCRIPFPNGRRRQPRRWPRRGAGQCVESAPATALSAHSTG